MGSIPIEFDPCRIDELSAPEAQVYRTKVTSADLMRSVMENNPEIYFVPPKRGSEWGQWVYKEGAYYDTTTGSKHPHWKDKDLPKPTKDIAQLRQDLVKWGYCLGG